MLLILAEGAANAAGIFEVSSIAPAVSAVGSTGLAIWLAYYTQTKTLPDQQAAHRQERKEIEDRYDKMFERVLDEMKSQREQFDRWRMGGVK